jgi:hypothetical protein
VPFGMIGHLMVRADVVHLGVVPFAHVVLRVRRRGGFHTVGMGRGHAHARHRKGGDRESHKGDEKGA